MGVRVLAVSPVTLLLMLLAFNTVVFGSSNSSGIEGNELEDPIPKMLDEEGVVFDLDSEKKNTSGCPVKNVPVGKKKLHRSFPISGVWFWSESFKLNAMLELRIKPSPGRSMKKQKELDTYPLEIGFLSPTSSASWKIPVNIINYTFYDASTVLCPNVSADEDKNGTVDMFFRSAVPESEQISVDGILTIKEMANYKISTKIEVSGVTSSAVEPAVYFADLSEESMEVEVTSDDELCASVYVQKAVCPLVSSPENADYHLTYTKHARLFLSKEEIGSHVFVTFLTYPDDRNCGNFSVDEHRSMKNKRSQFSVLSAKQAYTLPVCCYLAMVTGMVILGVASLSIRYRWQEIPGEMKLEEDLPNGAEASNQPSSPSDSAAPPPDRDLIDLESRRAEEEGILETPGVLMQGLEADNVSTSSLIGSEGDRATSPSEFATTMTNVTGTTSCILTQLGAKRTTGTRLSELDLDDGTKDFPWYQLVAVLFVMLVVPLMVSNLVQRRERTGDGDLCYHNFLCANPLWIMRSFNNVLSNVSYVILGLAFLLIVKFEKWQYCARIIFLELGTETMPGPSRHFGILYGMGISLVSIGVCSAFYHVCPNSSTIEFDMVFIHVLLGLCMLKLFAFRHGASEPHVIYCLIAIILIVTAVTSIVTHDGVIWVVFVILHFFILPYLSMQIYYNGHIEFSLTAGKVAAHSFKNVVLMEMMHGHWKPLFTHRLVVLFLGNIINFVISVVVAVETGLNIQSYLFSFMLISLIAYFGYYVVCKYQVKERLAKTTVFFIVVAVAFWAVAVYCYANPPVDWKKTAAESRAMNHKCVFLAFYDNHDMWHLMSGGALFFSLLAVMTLDDKVQMTPRKEIKVF